MCKLDVNEYTMANKHGDITQRVKFVYETMGMCTIVTNCGWFDMLLTDACVFGENVCKTCGFHLIPFTIMGNHDVVMGEGEYCVYCHKLDINMVFTYNSIVFDQLSIEWIKNWLDAVEVVYSMHVSGGMGMI